MSLLAPAHRVSKALPSPSLLLLTRSPDATRRPGAGRLDRECAL